MSFLPWVYAVLQLDRRQQSPMEPSSGVRYQTLIRTSSSAFHMRILLPGSIPRLVGRPNSVVLLMPGKNLCLLYSFNQSENIPSNYSTVCHGSGPRPPGTRFSEDCLTLNIIRPSSTTADSSELPVLLWIHGGGYWEGSGADSMANGSYLGI
jgi:acetyl esterase/lipase